MSDALIQYLRDSKGWPRLGEEAADRIEELEAQLKTVLEREAATIARYDAKLDAAEAKLAEDIEALREVSQALDWQAHGACRGWSDNLLTPVNALKLASIAIAKIKGEQP